LLLAQSFQTPPDAVPPVWEGTAGRKLHLCPKLPGYKAEATLTEISLLTRAISKGMNNLTNSEASVSKTLQVAMGQVKEGCGR